jgi:hypothetical protein
VRAILTTLLVACALAIVPSAASATFHYTHRISVQGQITDNWTTSNTATCSSNGSGSVTATFQTSSMARLRPFIARFSDALRTNKPRRWIMGVPVGGGVGDMKSLPVTGVITTVDNTVQSPQDPQDEGPCTPTDKAGCGTAPMHRAHVLPEGYDRRSLLVELILDRGNPFQSAPTQNNSRYPCRMGSLEGWAQPAAVVGGPQPWGDLVAKMPSPSKLAHKHIVKVTGTTHQVSTTPFSVNGTEINHDDVTRTVTVTFTRL